MHVMTPRISRGRADPVHTATVVPSEPLRVTTYETVSPDVNVVGAQRNTTPVGSFDGEGTGVTAGSKRAPENLWVGPLTDPERRASVLPIRIDIVDDAVARRMTSPTPSRRADLTASAPVEGVALPSCDTSAEGLVDRLHRVEGEHHRS